MKTKPLSVLILDTKQNNPNYYIVLAIEQALRRNPQVCTVTRADYATVIRVAQEQCFDLLLALDGEEGNRAILSRLLGLVGVAVLWCWEDPYETARTADLAPLFDLVFTNDIASASRYSPPALHLPLAASERREVLSNDGHYRYDVAFVGTAWPNRVTFLRRLLRARPDLRYRICLSYNEHLPNTYLDLPESSYIGAVSHFDFLDIANHSRVNLVLHRRFSGDGLSKRAETPGPRIFETALAGGFQLVDGDEMELADLYQDGREVCAFGGFEDALERLDFLLAKPKRRIAMALSAQKRTAAEHSYDQRVAKILEMSAATHLRPPAPVWPTLQARRRLLFVTHNRIARGNFGGVEVYQETIADQLRADYEIFYYQPSSRQAERGLRFYELTDSRHRVLRTMEVPDFDPVTILWHAPSEEAFSLVLDHYQIGLVHFHHLINHSPSLPLVCRALGIPSVYTFQDFWTICTRFNLLDYKRQYCRIHERSRMACNVCLSSADGRPVGSQAIRRSFFSEVLQSIDRIVFNSPASAAICRSVYPELPETSIAELGLPVPWTTMHRPAASVESRAGRRPLRVVFFGNFTYGKGAETFLDLLRHTRDANVAFTIAGRLDAGYAEQLGGYAETVTVLGEFAPGTLDFTKFDVSLHLSVWPETYCITLSEAWRAGILPIVTDCGALADRVHDGVNGFKIPLGGVGELLELVVRLEGNRRELDAIRSNISPDLWLTPAEHCSALSALYRDLQIRHPLSKRRTTTTDLSLVDVQAAPPASRVHPPHWHQADWPVVPGLPSPHQASRNPLRTQVAALRTALEQQSFGSEGLSICVDSFAHLAEIETSNPTVSPWIPGRPPIQIVGWLECVSPPGEITLVVRSSNGDVIMRPVYLHDREDLAAPKAGSVRLGFLTDPFAADMLQNGVYELALALQQGGRFTITPMTAAVSCYEHLSALIQTHGTRQVREPFTGQALPTATPTHSCPFHYNVDELLVHILGPDSHAPLPFLSVDGWTLATAQDDPKATLMLELRGPESFRSQLTRVERPDVLQAFLVDGPLCCGFKGAVWLKSLPPGSYEVILVRPVRGSRFERLIGSLNIAVNAEDAYVQAIIADCPEQPQLELVVVQ